MEKRKREEDEFEFEAPPLKWRTTKQNVLGSNFRIFEPIDKIENSEQQIEFHLKSDSVWAFGPNTRFQVGGVFEVNAGTAGAEWTTCTAADVKKVVVQPNYLESCFRTIGLFHNNQEIKYTDEERYISAWLNAYLYNYMDPDVKKKMCIDAACTANMVPNKVDDWKVTSVDGWLKKGEILFGQELEIDWIPMHVPFMFQHSNYLEMPNKVLPIPILEKFIIRIQLHEHQEHIFKKVAQDATKYRFRFTKFLLLVEELRLTNSFLNSLTSKNHKVFTYPGVTRIMKAETITAAVQSYRLKFQTLAFPEGIFIFCAPKDIFSGNNKYLSNTTANVFLPHNIAEITGLTFDDQKMFADIPNIGTLSDDSIKYKTFFDYMEAPPFGMKMDKDKIQHKNVNGHQTPYPHVFISLTNTNSDKGRLIPITKLDSNILKDDHDLGIHLTFNATGATAESMYIFYFYYTDKQLMLDPKTKIFSSPYIKY